MAMVDAGFPMKCLVCAVSCALSENGDIQLDPTLEQEKVYCLGVIYISHNRRGFSIPKKGLEQEQSAIPSR